MPSSVDSQNNPYILPMKRTDQAYVPQPLERNIPASNGNFFVSDGRGNPGVLLQQVQPLGNPVSLAEERARLLQAHKKRMDELDRLFADVDARAALVEKASKTLEQDKKQFYKDFDAKVAELSHVKGRLEDQVGLMELKEQQLRKAWESFEKEKASAVADAEAHLNSLASALAASLGVNLVDDLTLSEGGSTVGGNFAAGKTASSGEVNAAELLALVDKVVVASGLDENEIDNAVEQESSLSNKDPSSTAAPIGGRLQSVRLQMVLKSLTNHVKNLKNASSTLEAREKAVQEKEHEIELLLSSVESLGEREQALKNSVALYSNLAQSASIASPVRARASALGKSTLTSTNSGSPLSDSIARSLHVPPLSSPLSTPHEANERAWHKQLRQSGPVSPSFSQGVTSRNHSGISSPLADVNSLGGAPSPLKSVSSTFPIDDSGMITRSTNSPFESDRIDSAVALSMLNNSSSSVYPLSPMNSSMVNTVSHSGSGGSIASTAISNEISAIRQELQFLVSNDHLLSPVFTDSSASGSANFSSDSVPLDLSVLNSSYTPLPPGASLAARVQHERREAALQALALRIKQREQALQSCMDALQALLAKADDRVRAAHSRSVAELRASAEASIRDQEAKFAQEQRKLDDRAAELARREEASRLQDEKNRSLHNNLQKSSEKVAELKKLVETTEVRVAELNSQLQATEKGKKEVESSMANASAEIAQLRLKLAEAEFNASSTKSELQKLEAAAKEWQMKAESAAASAQNDKRSSDSELVKAKADIQVALQEAQKARDDAAEAHAQKEEADKLVEKLRGELVEANEKIMNSILSAGEIGERAASELQLAASRLEAFENELSEANATASVLKEKLDVKESELHLKTSQIESLVAAERELQQQLQHKSGELAEALLASERLSDELALLHSTSASQSSEFQVVQAELERVRESARVLRAQNSQLVEELAASRSSAEDFSGRLEAAQKSEMDLRANLKELTQRVFELAEEVASKDLRLSEKDAIIAELEQQAVSRSSAMAKSSSDAEARLIELQQRVDEALRKEEEIAEELRISNADLDAVREELDSARKDGEVARNELDAQLQELTEAKETIRSISSLLDSVKSELEASKNELEVSKSALEASSIELDALKGQIASTSEETARWKDQFDSATSEIASLKQELETAKLEGSSLSGPLLDELVDLRERFALADADRIELTDAATSLRQDLVQARARVGELESELAQETERLAGLREHLLLARSAARADLDAAEERFHGIQRRLTLQESQTRDAQQLAQVHEARAKEYEARAKELQDRLLQEEITREGLERELQSIADASAALLEERNELTQAVEGLRHAHMNLRRASPPVLPPLIDPSSPDQSSKSDSLVSEPTSSAAAPVNEEGQESAETPHSHVEGDPAFFPASPEAQIALNTQVEALKLAREEAEQRASELAVQVERMQLQLHELEQQLESTNEAKLEASLLNESLELRLQSQVEEARAALDAADAANTSLKAEIEQQAERLEKAESCMTESSSLINSLRQQLQAQSEEATQHSEQLQRRLDETVAHVNFLEQKIAQLKSPVETIIPSADTTHNSSTNGENGISPAAAKEALLARKAAQLQAAYLEVEKRKQALENRVAAVSAAAKERERALNAREQELSSRERALSSASVRTLSPIDTRNIAIAEADSSSGIVDASVSGAEPPFAALSGQDSIAREEISREIIADSFHSSTPVKQLFQPNSPSSASVEGFVNSSSNIIPATGGEEDVEFELREISCPICGDRVETASARTHADACLTRARAAAAGLPSAAATATSSMLSTPSAALRSLGNPFSRFRGRAGSSSSPTTVSVSNTTLISGNAGSKKEVIPTPERVTGKKEADARSRSSSNASSSSASSNNNTVISLGSSVLHIVKPLNDPAALAAAGLLSTNTTSAVISLPPTHPLTHPAHSTASAPALSSAPPSTSNPYTGSNSSLLGFSSGIANGLSTHAGVSFFRGTPRKKSSSASAAAPANIHTASGAVLPPPVEINEAGEDEEREIEILSPGPTPLSLDAFVNGSTSTTSVQSNGRTPPGILSPSIDWEAAQSQLKRTEMRPKEKDVILRLPSIRSMRSRSGTAESTSSIQDNVEMASNPPSFSAGQ